MYVPNGWVPSDFAKYVYSGDAQGEFSEAQQLAAALPQEESGAIRRFPTDAERFDSVAFFMRHNIGVNAFKRNYTVQPGGEIVYFKNRS